MPWKIVNLDYASDAPHLHMKDPQAPIHLRAFFDDRRIEIGLGAEEPDACFVRATVTPDEIAVDAIRFEPLHVNILASILASLDVEPDERDDALAWMRDRVVGGERARDGFFVGNVGSFPPPTGWPYELTDAALLDSIADPGEISSTRRRALFREAERRGLRQRDRGPQGPEVSFRRRPPAR